MAFLEILTRSNRRPNMLRINRNSVARQTDDDWVQRVLVDPSNQGVGWAQKNMGEYAPYLTGDYVLILDDDDMLCHDTLVQELKAIAAEHDPDVIMVKMNHGERGTLPDAHSWGQPPVCGRLGCSAYVVKRELWQAHADAWLSAKYASDFDFIHSVWQDDPVIYWHDVIASRVQAISYGVTE